jgi:oligoendopeptidase F
MGMELLAMPHLGEFYPDQAEADRHRRTHLEELARVLPWIATIDAFQHWIYLNPGHTRAERTQAWLDLDRRFGADLDWSGLEQHREIMWQRQLHLFAVPLYYIEYGIAQLGALQLWLASKRSAAEALKNYKQGLSLGGARPLPELFNATQLKFEFGPEIMLGLMREVQGELKRLPA